MADMPDISGIAALVGDPARAGMLTALTSGTALTATELSLEAGILPSTASSHLGKLRDAGFLAMQRQGRHRYFRLAGPEIADLLEKLMGICGRRPEARADRSARRRASNRARLLRPSRGQPGRALPRRPPARGLLVVDANGHEDPADRGLMITDPGRRFFSRLGIDVASLPRTRRPAVPCLPRLRRAAPRSRAPWCAELRHIYKERWATSEIRRPRRALPPRGLRLSEGLLSEADPAPTKRPAEPLNPETFAVISLLPLSSAE